MKQRIIIIGLVCILAILIFRLGIKKFGIFEEKAEKKEENIEVLQMMSESENEYAYEKYINQLCNQNETTSCSLEYLEDDGVMPVAELPQNAYESSEGGAASRIDANSEDKLPAYSKLYPNLYADKICPSESEKTDKIAYLTFDDGPSTNTLEILRILKEKNAVATFFVLGSTITDDGEEALKEMVDMGCTIGMHTYSHDRRKLYGSVESFLNDINQVHEQIYNITGQRANIYRFPWGSYNNYSKHIKKDLVCEMERRGFTYYDWNVSAEDSVGKPTSQSIMRNIMKDVKRYNCPVILMHDSNVNKLTVRVLPTVIDRLIEMGYTFDTLDHREPCQFCW